MSINSKMGVILDNRQTQEADLKTASASTSASVFESTIRKGA